MNVRQPQSRASLELPRAHFWHAPGMVLAACSLLVTACAKPLHRTPPYRPPDTAILQDYVATIEAVATESETAAAPRIAATSYEQPLDDGPMMAADESASGPGPGSEQPRGPVARAASGEDGPPEMLPSATWEDQSHDSPADWEMTVDELMQYALEHHPSLRARRHEVEVAEGALVTAGLLPNPRLVLDTESPVHERRPTELETRVMFTIPTGGKRWLRSAVAAAGIRRAETALALQREAILLEAADAAIEVLYYQDLSVLNGELAELAQRVAEAERPPRLDRLPELQLADQVDARVDAADLEADLRQTRTLLTVAQLRLSRAAGLPLADAVRVQGELGADDRRLLPLEAVLAIARDERPELAEARAALVESSRQHALAQAEARPDIEVGPRYEDSLGEERDRIGVRVNVDLPLFDRNQGEICAAGAQVRANQATFEVAELTTLGDVASAYMELVSIQRGLASYGRRMQELVEQTDALLGDEDIRKSLHDYEVAEIRLDLARMGARHLELRYQYRRLLALLEIFLGQPVTLPDQHPDGGGAIPAVPSSEPGSPR